MKDIKTHPEDVIDSLKDKKKKNVLNNVPLKTVTGATSKVGKLQEQLENEAYKLEYVNWERDGRMRDETLESNLRVAFKFHILQLL